MKLRKNNKPIRTRLIKPQLQKKKVPKRQVVDCLEGKLTSNMMMNTNSPAGYICRWKTYDKKDVMKSDFYTYFNSNTLNAGIEVLPVDAKKGDKT